MFGLLGEKLGHSFSKEIHESINDYIYNLIEVSKDNFDKFMIDRKFNSINVTIPYKEMVIPYLSYIDPKAKEIGAVNTIVNIDDKLYGYNTDYLGLKRLIIKNNISFENKKVLILGTGGTSKTAYVLSKDLGCSEVVKVSRKQGDNTITYDEAKNSYNDANIIINTTPCGMYPNDDLIIELDNFNNLEAVVDVIYNPLNTKLIRKAKMRNIKAVNGLYMLVAQAVYASYIFINKEVDENKIEEVYKKIKNTKLNISLIGMPSCGKTTISKMLGELLNKNIIDTDEEIEKEINMPISSFLNKDNESDFRDIESEVIDNVSKYNNVIISTGGGVIKRNDNIDRLRRNSLIIFIDRDLHLLQSTSSRPLSSNKVDLEKLYNERYSIYKKSCDYIIKNNDNIEEVIKEILEVYYENISY